MSTATMQPPVVPPRPARSQDKDEPASSMPKVPPRPIKHRFDRSVSPARFAPSPLNESFLSRSPKATRASPPNGNGYLGDSIERPGSVTMPSVGEEGLEYDAVKDGRSSSPEHTRTVGDLKLHAPKPSLPAQSAKQRVAAVTRTDSDRAAAFGIGKPSSEDPSQNRSSVKKKASASQISGSDTHFDDHGIPEIGQRVPMNPYAGDIQAPSPAPGVSGITEGLKSARHHNRRTSARDLPPGSYGLHSHGVSSTDKLDKQYYEKHPELFQREKSPLLDRQNEFALPSSELNKIVRETASRGSGVGTTNAFGTPSEELGYQAQEEFASRISSPQPGTSGPKTDRLASSLGKNSGNPDVSVTSPEASSKDDGVIHIDDSASRRRSVQFNNEASTYLEGDDSDYNAPILAPDEVAKDPSPAQFAAVDPPPERRGSAFEIEDPPSRPTSRPSSIYREVTNLSVSSPLEDVQEYEPLFDEKEAPKETPSPKKSKPRHQFPSRDVWEDAPESIHHDAEVSAPEVDAEALKQAKKLREERAETPAAAFARRFDELAEKEPRKSSAPIKQHPISEKPNWLPLQEPRFQESRPNMSGRFPSRDVWEDTPDSHMMEATVGEPQEEEEQQEPIPEAKPQVPSRPQKKLTDPTTAKPAVPERPKPKPATPDDKAGSSPVDTDKPKPQVPARPSKSLHSGASSKEMDASSKPKPAVPVRPMGSKIAALQAGFMSDLNNRLRLGPQAPKKEEPVTQDLTEEKEKAPLADARKGRARGPQRRAPGTSPSPAASLKSEAKPEASSFSFTMPMTMWSVDPEEGSLHTHEEEEKEKPVEVEAPTKEESEEETKKGVTPAEDMSAAEGEVTKTLASNMAGEPVAEATIQKESDKVEVEDVKED